MQGGPEPKYRHRKVHRSTLDSRTTRNTKKLHKVVMTPMLVSQCLRRSVLAFASMVRPSVHHTLPHQYHQNKPDNLEL
eukprot:3279312-Amphidinium_carterae.1